MRTTITAQAGQALRGKSLLAAMALALLVSVGVATDAGAERPPSGGDSHQRGCRAIYDAAERLRSEYLQVALANPNSARLDAITAEGRVLGQDWIAAKCHDRYGSIAHLMVSPFHPITNVPVHAITTETVHAITDDVVSATQPLLAEPSSVVTLADITLEPATEPVLAPMSGVEPATELTLAPEAEVIPVPEDAPEGDVIGSVPYSPEAGVIHVPEPAAEGDVIGSIPYSPEAEVIVVHEVEGDVIGSVPPSPVAEEIPVSEHGPEGDVIGSIPADPRVIPVSEPDEDVIGSIAVAPEDDQP